MQISYSQRFRFGAIHRLRDSNCHYDEPRYHGHSYLMTVTLTGAVDAETGTLKNRNDFRNYIEDEILPQLDKSDLNELLPIPSGEMLAVQILNRLRATKFGANVRSVHLQETSKNSYIASY